MKIETGQIADALEKTIGQRLKTAGIAGLVGLGMAASAPAQAPEPTKAQIEAAAPKEDFGAKPEDRFLWSIMQVESSGGKNTRHKKLKAGMHAGEHALGRWGLMPKTIQEMATRAKSSGKDMPGLESLASMDNAGMDSFLKKNPTVELAIARALAQHVLRRQGYNREKAAYAWYNGHNLFSNEIPSEDAHASEYVKRFLQANKLNPIRPAKTLSKADGSTFRERFGDWYKRRDAQSRAHLPPDDTLTPDPGRRRDEQDKKDEQMRADEHADIRGRIKSKIRNASDNYGGGKDR